MFLDLFRALPLRDAQRQASEIDAARSTAEALDEILSKDGEGLGTENIEDNEPEDAAEPKGPVAEDTVEPPTGTSLIL